MKSVTCDLFVDSSSRGEKKWTVNQNESICTVEFYFSGRKQPTCFLSFWHGSSVMIDDIFKSTNSNYFKRFNSPLTDGPLIKWVPLCLLSITKWSWLSIHELGLEILGLVTKGRSYILIVILIQTLESFNFIKKRDRISL